MLISPPRLGLLIVLSTFFATATFASTSTPALLWKAAIESQSGFYVDGSLGSEKSGHTSKIRQPHLIDATGGGYQFNSYFGLEGKYTKLQSVGTLYTPPSKGDDMIEAAAKGILPFASGFDLFGKLGVARIGNKFTQNSSLGEGASSSGADKILPYFGAGATYSISKRTDFTVQLAGAPDSDAKLTIYGMTGELTHYF